MTTVRRTPCRRPRPARVGMPVAVAVAFAFAFAAFAALPARARDAAGKLHDPREVRLAEVRQLTFDGENAEAYWSFDGTQLVYQASGGEVACDQIFRLDPQRPGERTMVSTGLGRTTCAYFLPGDQRIVYASTHFADRACPPPPDRSQGYVWPVYAGYEIVSVRPDGSDLVRLTDNDAYDAEATVCPADGSIVFTSTRDGDLDLYRMDADGGNVERLTDTAGYDGGAFFDRTCERIVWRASRPVGDELADYRRLLDRGLVRPGKLEVFVANADGTDARRVTYLEAASFAPFFHPDGERILFSTNHGSASGREFEIYSIRVDGSGLERITYTAGFDGFPMFSPDGRYLAFSSNRNQAKPGDTNVFVARWVETVEAEGSAPSAADRFRDDVAWLAADARGGRGIGSPGLEDAARYIAERFDALGFAPAGDRADGTRSFFQAFDVAVAVARGPRTALAIGGRQVDAEALTPLGFSAGGTVDAEVVAVGFGIHAPELEHDDYAEADVDGKIAVVRRFVPVGERFDDNEAKRRYGDLRYKAFTARERGAVGLIVVDLPEASGDGEVAEESPLPRLVADTGTDAGLPVVALRRGVGAPLFTGHHRVSLTVELEISRSPTHNVVARLAASGDADGGSSSTGPIVIGAHYDHLGMGGQGSLAPDEQAPHNGADDNASGTAALFEIGRQLGARRHDLRRDVWLVAFSAEESGLLGSTHFAKHPPDGLDLDRAVAMINLDMVGRLREKLSVLGAGSAEEWQEIVPPVCDALDLACVLGGDGYGPSDQTPFYAAGIPVLHLFTGTHQEYHRPSDDSDLINAAGGVRVATLAADLATELARRAEPLTYVSTSAPAPRGDTRSYGASLGTIPDYADEQGGVLLAGVRPGSAAEQAGIQRGDRLLGLAGKDIGDIYDFMYILRDARPGDTVLAVVERAGERVELEVTFGMSTTLR